jgi:Ca2+-binding RTX toxin-like protein
MSYRDNESDWMPDFFAGYGFAATPMAFDIAAIQYLYGANTSNNSGANTYAITDALSGTGVSWQTIWDTGGIDTISYSGSSDVYIDLRSVPLSGGFDGTGTLYKSYIPSAVGGYLIADGVVIEIATGGSGDDYLTGNSYNNYLFGGLGDDFLTGLGGDDLLSGGDGSDWVNYIFSSSGVEVLLDVNGLATGDGIDTLYSIENVIGSGYDDVLVGNTGSNILYGAGGKDYLTGGTGSDTFVVSFGSGSLYLANADIFTDYDDAYDYIGLTGGITTADISIYQVGANAVIYSGSEYLAVLMNTNSSSITAYDFLYV